MQLPCGCIRGEYLCREAVRLWSVATACCAEISGTFNPDESWVKYEAALEEYNAHFGRDEIHGTMPLR